MQSPQKVEIILLPSSALTNKSRDQLVRWLKTTLPDIVNEQEPHIKTMFLKLWTQTPAIYMS